MRQDTLSVVAGADGSVTYVQELGGVRSSYAVPPVAEAPAVELSRFDRSRKAWVPLHAFADVETMAYEFHPDPDTNEAYLFTTPGGSVGAVWLDPAGVVRLDTVSPGLFDAGALRADRRAFRANVRNFLIAATPDELRTEIVRSLERGDRFRAWCALELLNDPG